jgi:glutamate mutase epsilon subunit
MGKEEERPDSNDSDLLPKTIDSKAYDYHYDKSEIASNRSIGSNMVPVEPVNPEIKMIFEKEKNNIEKDLMKKQYRSQHRLLNPTNLSYEGSVVRNSGILASLGKNLANG